LPKEQRPRGIEVNYTFSKEVFTYPLVYPAHCEAPSDVFGEAYLPMSLLVHEMAELLLVLPEAPPFIVPDGRVKLAGLSYQSHHHTRWFRDGYANYASWIALQELKRATRGEWDHTALFPLQTPFSSLEKTRTDLLRWRQNKASVSEESNYNACFGLFLALEQDFGIEKLARLPVELATVRYPDGEAIEKTINRVYGFTLTEYLAETPFFPDLGIDVSKRSTSGKALRVFRPLEDCRMESCSGPIRLGSVNQVAVPNRLSFEQEVFLNLRAGKNLTLEFINESE
ncbi:MAG: hypothetical protein AAF514_09315, partial [Verrucomicrobiota bacterium]